MRAQIIDANGEIFDLGDIEITEESTLDQLVGGRPVAMPATLVTLYPNKSPAYEGTFAPSTVTGAQSLLEALQTPVDRRTMADMDDAVLAPAARGWPDPERRGARKTRRGRRL